MIHLTEDELIRLSQIELELKACNDHDRKLINHLKECKECCENYCLMRTIYSVGSDLGRMILPEVLEWKDMDQAVIKTELQMETKDPDERVL